MNTTPSSSSSSSSSSPSSSSMIQINIVPDPENDQLILYVENPTNGNNRIIKMDIVEDELDLELDWEYEDEEDEEFEEEYDDDDDYDDDDMFGQIQQPDTNAYAPGG
ncbi:unnamed protein product [Rotaria sp. Silwood2]|nr:unnamed protein product [Rotaria sp. Silwood2]CAF3017264.1 unnamed protein product [Rotaria sp. Silwood2]CAF3277186.1 unnamed protein product [Rotaria sp. Silwood2]CAF3353246.1 unnamed protein product [Rotaria sp. Silwood2]CAF4011101.1 unnamed protein product [Rotaria sp. Silwood2]